MYMRKTILISLCLFTLSACNNKIVEDAQEVKDNNDTKETEEKEKLEEIHETVVEEGATLDEVKEEISTQLEKKTTVDIKEVKKKEEFTEANEFAQYAAAKLYKFQKGILSPNSYYEFIVNFGSRVYLRDVDSKGKKEMIKGFKDLQDSLSDAGTEYNGYKLSEVTKDKTGIYAYFYRVIETTESIQSYRTTMVKEGSAWKLDSDILSPGYKEIEK